MNADQPKADILIVDDTFANLQLLSSMLTTQGYKVRPANSGPVGLNAARNAKPDLILLDVKMPGMNGYEVCELLKADEGLCDIPVIFVSALDTAIDKVRAFDVGAVDYVTKPLQVEEVVARVNTQLTLYRQRQELERQRDEIMDLRQRERTHYEELSRLKDEFVQAVSHDLKNPVHTIINFVYMLERNGTIADPDEAEILQQIRSAAQRMNDLIMDLLDLSRLEAGKALTLHNLSLNDFLRFRLSEFQISLPRHDLTFTFMSEDEKIFIMMDPMHMGQVVTNVLSNAAKYTPSEGNIAVSLRRQGDEALVTISDNGLGIPKDDVPHLFERFYRVKAHRHIKQEGTGLGLAIVKAIVEQHSGHIWVESQLGQGTDVHIALPITSEAI